VPDFFWLLVGLGLMAFLWMAGLALVVRTTRRTMHSVGEDLAIQGSKERENLPGKER
jgi:hypothetical protein